MTELQKRFLADWEAKRQRGKVRFVLYTGLAWATIMTTIMTCYQAFMVRGGSWAAILATCFSWELPFWFLFYGVFGGPIYGLVTWYFNEQRYQKLIKRR